MDSFTEIGKAVIKIRMKFLLIPRKENVYMVLQMSLADMIHRICKKTFDLMKIVGCCMDDNLFEVM